MPQRTTRVSAAMKEKTSAERHLLTGTAGASSTIGKGLELAQDTDDEPSSRSRTG